jgi:hypothetical protein
VAAPDDAVRRRLLKAYNVGCLIIVGVLAGAFVYWLVGLLS